MSEDEAANTAGESILGGVEDRYSLLTALFEEIGANPENLDEIKAAIEAASANVFRRPVLSVLLAPEVAEVAQEQGGNISLYEAYVRLQQKAEGRFPTA